MCACALERTYESNGAYHQTLFCTMVDIVKKNLVWSLLIRWSKIAGCLVNIMTYKLWLYSLTAFIFEYTIKVIEP